MALATPSAPLGGPNRTVRVNSQRAKIKPASVKWPRPGHVTNAVTELNETLICSEWQNGQELLILLTGSQMKIHWVYYGLDCYQWFYAAVRQGFGGIFLFPSYSSWECDSLKWWINQTFWWLVFFCEYKAPGQVLFDYFVVMLGWGEVDGCGCVL